MWAAVVVPSRPLKVMFTVSVWASMSNTTMVEPVAGDGTGGDSAAPLNVPM
ncbi:hypothetical protein D3C86_1874950 [compost metagenome]